MSPDMTHDARALRRTLTNQQLDAALTRVQREHTEAADRLRANIGTDDEPEAREQMERTQRKAHALRLALDMDPAMQFDIRTGRAARVVTYLTQVDGLPAAFRIEANPAPWFAPSPLIVRGQSTAHAVARLLADDDTGDLTLDARRWAAAVLDLPSAPTTEADVDLTRAAEVITTHYDGGMERFVLDARADANVTHRR